LKNLPLVDFIPFLKNRRDDLRLPPPDRNCGLSQSEPELTAKLTMGGGYISCGNFLGDDKSGSAFVGVLRGIPTVLSAAEAAAFRVSLAEPLMAMLEDSQELEITPQRAAELFEPLRKFHEHLRAALGDPEPCHAPELDRKLGVNMTNAKYGEGTGWQFYCTHDLLHACELSQKSKEPIGISFD
jgi:hypothetical protein